MKYRVSLRWIAILRDQLSISLAASSGVHFSDDAVKLLLVGADVVMMTSALLKHGIDYAREFIDQLHDWLEVNEYKSIEQLKGSMSRGNCPEPSDLERANYMKAADFVFHELNFDSFWIAVHIQPPAAS